MQDSRMHAESVCICGSVFEYVHNTWWSKYMHFQIEFQLNNIAFAYFPNLRISGVQKFWIPDTSRQWAMESYSSKCLAKTILFKLSLLNILFGVRLLFFARNPHYARAMNCKWCCTMQMLQIFIFSVLSISVHFFMDRSIAWKTNCQSIHVQWNGSMKRTACPHAYPSKVSHIATYIGFYTFCERQKWAYNSWFNHHFTIVCILISHAQPHSLSNLSSRVS